MLRNALKSGDTMVSGGRHHGVVPTLGPAPPPPAELALSGPSVAVGSGVHLCMSVARSMSHFFSPARIELGGSFFEVRAGVHLGVSFTSSLSSNSI